MDPKNLESEGDRLRTILLEKFYMDSCRVGTNHPGTMQEMNRIVEEDGSSGYR